MTNSGTKRDENAALALTQVINMDRETKLLQVGYNKSGFPSSTRYCHVAAGSLRWADGHNLTEVYVLF
jgi:hypothetical protein